MKATIEININTKRKYGYVNLTFADGGAVCGDIWEDEFDSVESIERALKEIVKDYIEKDMCKKLNKECE